MISEDLFGKWYAALEERHLRTLTFQEVRRALQALSSLYVERRDQSSVRRALDTAGKRAAFALFYAPLHLLQTSHVVEQLGLKNFPMHALTDLGCGTGTGGAAWSLELGGSPRVTGVDLNPWVLEEARWNYHSLAVNGETRKADLLTLPLPASGGTLLAFTANELDEPSRVRLLRRLLQRRLVLVVEPIARRVAPWWEGWAEAFELKGGRADQWTFSPAMPERLRLLDKAAGLDHRELKCRSLWLPPGT
ncbi:MAG: class I SAM-dependent methyltransferase [Acidobacteria bacterium]|nr:MAG: class I SAM-dependent methyltransferase [Acidobacteriota bacterium]